VTLTKTRRRLVISSGVQRGRDDHRDVASFRRLVHGDRNALADLYDAHAGRLFRHALALTRSRADAEDLVQAVFVKLATTGAPLLAVRAPANYLHRMLRAAWIDASRRPSARLEERSEPDADYPAPDCSGVTEAGIDATTAVARLPALQREIVNLHLVEGFSFREAGRITRVSTFTAASRYRAALERLREMVSGQ
jgi:RNA polymerase sigma-70 factor, ECF subfamily